MNSYKFPTSHRLRTPGGFTRLFRQGRRLRMTPFAIIYAPNNLLYPRLGIAVAKRIVPRATDRNHLKRLIRESFRLHSMTLNSIDIIIQCTEVPAPMKGVFLRETLGKIWHMLSKRCNQV